MVMGFKNIPGQPGANPGPNPEQVKNSREAFFLSNSFKQTAETLVERSGGKPELPEALKKLLAELDNAVIWGSDPTEEYSAERTAKLTEALKRAAAEIKKL